jgi:hypothetical protein
VASTTSSRVHLKIDLKNGGLINDVYWCLVAQKNLDSMYLRSKQLKLKAHGAVAYVLVVFQKNRFRW